MLTTIFTNEAPAAIGPYSQAIKLDKLLFTSGQIPVNPKIGEVVDGEITEQAHQFMKNVQAVLEEGNASFNTVIKTTCFITNMADFADFNSVYEQYFTANKPARSCVAVKELPKGVLCEVEVIALTEDN
ncbi:RidA family protein [Bacillus sp. V2I10]|uniref:RidA family protein n=1 Tax=Bacillus sp. V2I10 TaxID=3042276 RepID=UPI0027811A44|nr:RidA family protein [Bacillus sp. V2I10]MDQ0857869.1 2-iminobutanoate/2-iminopropanoate deaminase [Bacillus sp. V2I10]